MKNLKSIPIELICWVSALVLLATADPHAHHFTLCPLANLGVTWCPGCGLGRSITSLFHGEVRASFEHHWLGIPALMIIGFRIYQLTEKLFKKENNLKNRRISNV